jgi:heme-binding protein
MRAGLAVVRSGYPEQGLGSHTNFEGLIAMIKRGRISAYRRAVGVCAGCVLGGMGIGVAGAPSATAAPDCTQEGVTATVSAVTGSARQYLDSHPDANQAARTAAGLPHDQAAATLRDYFRSHPQQYRDLHGILAPVADTERKCNVAALPPNVESAFHEFMVD